MFLLLKRIIFKLMEMSLGLRPMLPLATRDPVFLNFELSDSEREAVARALPAGFELAPLRFVASDQEPAYWVSYNLYRIGYPRPELAAVRKARCEINTFVRDAEGKEGIFVFCGTPYVSREEGGSFLGRVCDAAERLVTLLYGCGKLTSLHYEVGERLEIRLNEGDNAVLVDVDASAGKGGERLSDDYARFNDVSYFNAGRTFDRVLVDSAFALARFSVIDASGVVVQGPFFRRAPDRVYLHRGQIDYVVSALHRGRS